MARPDVHTAQDPPILVHGSHQRGWWNGGAATDRTRKLRSETVPYSDNIDLYRFPTIRSSSGIPSPGSRSTCLRQAIHCSDVGDSTPMATTYARYLLCVGVVQYTDSYSQSRRILANITHII